MKQLEFKSYDELPLFLHAKTVAQVLDISVAGTYELLYRKDSPVVKIGSRLVVPKKQFLAWVFRYLTQREIPTKNPMNSITMIKKSNFTTAQPDGTLMALSPHQVSDLLGHSTSRIIEMDYVKKDTTRLQGITDGFNL